MKILLPPDIAQELAGPLADCQNNSELSPSILAGQVRRGDYEEGTDNVFLLLKAIRPKTARKIRRLIERERARTQQ